MAKAKQNEAEGEVIQAPAKRKKGQNVSVTYLDKAGTEHKTVSGIPADVVGLRVVVEKAGFEHDIILKELPKSILVQAAAFGLNTASRNEVNTAKAGDAVTGAANLSDRISGWMAGLWRPEGEGESVQTLETYIDALKRAFTKAGKADVLAEKEPQWRSEYEACPNKDERAKLRDRWLGVPAVRAEYDAIKAEQAYERMRARQEKSAAVAGSDLGGL